MLVFSLLLISVACNQTRPTTTTLEKQRTETLDSPTPTSNPQTANQPAKEADEVNAAPPPAADPAITAMPETKTEAKRATKPKSVAAIGRGDIQGSAGGVEGGVVGGVAGGTLSGAASNPAARKIAPQEEREDSTEQYTNYGVNQLVETAKDRFSTFAIDVDTASYTIARRKLNEGQLPPAPAVRVEEFVNYFKYQYIAPATAHPFALTLEGAPSPLNQRRHLLRVGVQGRQVEAQQRPDAHLTFLVDTSGSMQSADKIGLLKESLKLLVNNLRAGDTVAITTYAGGVSIVLPPTSAANKGEILAAISNLNTGGGTAMSSGIELAYQQAHAQLKRNAINRIIICSDGDANIGNTSPTAILKQIEGYVKEGVTVSTIGFGMGNYKDTMMEQFANKGNGNYYYIDNLAQARRVFGEQLTGTLQVIAKDVKIQVEFNPNAVARYRLLGYENRDIADKDFRNDKVDAGEIGAGHTVTALYELELQSPVDPIATVRLRYKAPNGEQAQEVAAQLPSTRLHKNFAQASEDFRFSVAVAAFAEVLRESKEAKQWSLATIANIARQAAPAQSAERQEFLSLLDKAQILKAHATTPQ
jgi:Ca-activated chloride channel family protein